MRHPIGQSLPSLKLHAADLPEHLPDNLGHHLREARDRLAQVLDHDVVEHGLVRGPRQREHLPEQGLGDEELASLRVIRGEGQGAHLVRRRDGRVAPEPRFERPERVRDVLLGDETLEGTPVSGVPQSLGLLLGQDPARWNDERIELKNWSTAARRNDASDECRPNGWRAARALRSVRISYISERQGINEI